MDERSVANKLAVFSTNDIEGLLTLLDRVEVKGKEVTFLANIMASFQQIRQLDGLSQEQLNKILEIVQPQEEKVEKKEQ